MQLKFKGHSPGASRSQFRDFIGDEENTSAEDGTL